MGIKILNENKLKLCSNYLGYVSMGFVKKKRQREKEENPLA